MHIIAAKAVCFGEALSDSFKEYGKNVVENAQELAKTLQEKGFDLVSGGTDNHLILLDLRKIGITGKELETRLDQVYITVNKNAIPDDPEKPSVTSGVRIGTAAVTTRGLGKAEMRKIGDMIWRTGTAFETEAENIRREVTAICEEFKLY